MSDCILAIDQGTTSSRAMVFAPDGQLASSAQREFDQHFPDDGWVEHDAEQIWEVTTEVCRKALAKLGKDQTVRGIGITNQRETTVVWDRQTGKPIYPAIVWQDRRTAGQCRALADQGLEDEVRARTGLLLDPYFSATKVAWILERVDGARARAERGELLFHGHLSGIFPEAGCTPATNAGRTLLFNIHEQRWDPELLRIFAIPEAMLPRVHDCASDFGLATEGLDGRELPIAGVAGDQHAALIGQACFQPGMVKSTYGTGCFALMNIGETPRLSQHRLLTTVAYRLNGKTTYALEGAIFVAGAAVQWLRDKLGVIEKAEDTEALARSLDSNKGVYLVPAFTGLGAPHWDPEARGVLCGLTRDSGRAELARAALEAVCYQTRDLFQAMSDDAGARPDTLRVDGGMVANNWLLQMLADIVEVPVERPTIIETTALGAARLAGLQLGLFPSLEEVARSWQLERRCETQMSQEERTPMLAGWQRAVARTCYNENKNTTLKG